MEKDKIATITELVDYINNHSVTHRETRVLLDVIRSLVLQLGEIIRCHADFIAFCAQEFKQEGTDEKIIALNIHRELERMELPF